MTDVFLSYAQADESLARQLAEALREQGLSVWVDEENLQPGAEWASAIQSAIERSKNVVVLLSENSSKSEWVRREAAIALAGTKRVVPVFLSKHADIPFIMQHLQGVDLSDPERFGSVLKRLVRALKSTTPSDFPKSDADIKVRQRLADLDRSALEAEKLELEVARTSQGQRVGLFSVAASIFGVVVGLVSTLLTTETNLAWLAPVGYGLAGVVIGAVGALGAKYLAERSSASSRTEQRGDQ